MKKFYSLFFVFTIICTPLIAQFTPTGGPDEYGYTWRTNAAPNGPNYNWIDITTTGTRVTGLTDDNVVGPFSLGFDFQYYWIQYSQIFIGSNGYLSFERGNISSTGIGFPLTPSAAGPNDVIAPFMCDLNHEGALNPAEVYYQIDAANKQFIVSFIDVPFWIRATDFGGSNSFQVILNGQDSTITFQYQKQQGSWDPAYDTSTNPMVVGIENVTGRIGLPVENQSKPLPETAIQFYAPATSGVAIQDIAPRVVQTEDNSGIFITHNSNPGGSATFLKTEIANVGNTGVTSNITVRGRVKNASGTIVWQEQQAIPGLNEGEIAPIIFSTFFNPPDTGLYEYEVRVSNFDDDNNSNDIETTKLVAIDTTQTDVVFTYASQDTSNIDLSTGDNITFGGNIDVGVKFKVFGFPIIVKAIEYYTLFFQDSVRAGPAVVADLFGPSTDGSAPGPLLFRDTVDITEIPGQWSRVDVPESQGVIVGDEFYVGWEGLNSGVVLVKERIDPVSRNTYEVINDNWAEDRNNADTEHWIRVIADISNIAITTKREDDFINLNTFKVYPNPSRGLFKVELEFSNAQPITMVVRDLKGSKVMLEHLPMSRVFNKEIDISNVSPGIYFMEVYDGKEIQRKKIVVQ